MKEGTQSPCAMSQTSYGRSDSFEEAISGKQVNISSVKTKCSNDYSWHRSRFWMRSIDSHKKQENSFRFLFCLPFINAKLLGGCVVGNFLVCTQVIDHYKLIRWTNQMFVILPSDGISIWFFHCPVWTKHEQTEELKALAQCPKHHMAEYRLHSEEASSSKQIHFSDHANQNVQLIAALIIKENSIILV